MQKSIVFYLIITIIFWGTAPIFDKAALRGANPLLGTLLRGIIVGLLMILAAAVSGNIKSLFLFY